MDHQTGWSWKNATEKLILEKDKIKSQVAMQQPYPSILTVETSPNIEMVMADEWLPRYHYKTQHNYRVYIFFGAFAIYMCSLFLLMNQFYIQITSEYYYTTVMAAGCALLFIGVMLALGETLPLNFRRVAPRTVFTIYALSGAPVASVIVTLTLLNNASQEDWWRTALLITHVLSVLAVTDFLGYWRLVYRGYSSRMLRRWCALVRSLDGGGNSSAELVEEFRRKFLSQFYHQKAALCVVIDARIASDFNALLKERPTEVADRSIILSANGIEQILSVFTAFPATEHNVQTLSFRQTCDLNHELVIQGTVKCLQDGCSLERHFSRTLIIHGFNTNTSADEDLSKVRIVSETLAFSKTTKRKCNILPVFYFSD